MTQVTQCCSYRWRDQGKLDGGQTGGGYKEVRSIFAAKRMPKAGEMPMTDRSVVQEAIGMDHPALTLNPELAGSPIPDTMSIFWWNMTSLSHQTWPKLSDAVIRDAPGIVGFYAYSYPYAWSAATGLEQSSFVTLFSAIDAAEEFYVFYIIDKALDGTGGTLGLDVTATGALLQEARSNDREPYAFHDLFNADGEWDAYMERSVPFAPWQEGQAALPMMMRDDGWNRYTFDEKTGVARFDWWWLPCCTDGLIFGPLPYVVPDDGDGKQLAWDLTFKADCNDHAEVPDRPANPLHGTNGNGLDGLPTGMSGLDQGMAVYQFGTPWSGNKEPITRYEVPRNQLCDAYEGFQIHCGDCESECAAHNNCGECTVDMNCAWNKNTGKCVPEETSNLGAGGKTCDVCDSIDGECDCVATPGCGWAHFDDGSSRCIWGTADFTNVKAATVQWDPPCMCYKAAFNDKGTRAGGGDTGFSWDVAREYMGGHDPRGKLHDEVGINPVTDFNKVPVYDDLGLGKCVYVLGENQGYSNRQFVEETPTVVNVFEDDPTRWHDRGTHEAACVDLCTAKLDCNGFAYREDKPAWEASDKQCPECRQCYLYMGAALRGQGLQGHDILYAGNATLGPATGLLLDWPSPAGPITEEMVPGQDYQAEAHCIAKRAGYLNPKITDGVCTSINGGRRLQGDGRAEKARELEDGYHTYQPQPSTAKHNGFHPFGVDPANGKASQPCLYVPEALRMECLKHEPKLPHRDYWSQTGDQTCDQSDEVLGVEALYAYNFPHETSYNGGLVPRDAAISYLVQDDAGDTYMVLVIDRAHDGTGGEMVLDVRFENVQQVQGQDDPVIFMDDPTADGSDSYTWTLTGSDSVAQTYSGSARFEFDWKGCCTDGLILGPFSSTEPWTVHLDVDKKKTRGIDTFRIGTYDLEKGDTGFYELAAKKADAGWGGVEFSGVSCHDWCGRHSSCDDCSKDPQCQFASPTVGCVSKAAYVYEFASWEGVCPQPVRAPKTRVSTRSCHTLAREAESDGFESSALVRVEMNGNAFPRVCPCDAAYRLFTTVYDANWNEVAAVDNMLPRLDEKFTFIDVPDLVKGQTYHVWTYVCYAQGTLVRDKCSPPSKDTIVGGDNLSGGRFEDDDGYDPLDYPDC